MNEEQISSFGVKFEADGISLLGIRVFGVFHRDVIMRDVARRGHKTPTESAPTYMMLDLMLSRNNTDFEVEILVFIQFDYLEQMG